MEGPSSFWGSRVAGSQDPDPRAFAHTLLLPSLLSTPHPAKVFSDLLGWGKKPFYYPFSEHLIPLHAGCHLQFSG